MELSAGITAHIDQMAAFVDDVFVEMGRQWNQAFPDKGSFTEPVLAFIHAVDWTEPWLLSLIGYHIMLLIVAIRTRKNTNVQMGLFFFMLFSIYIAERLNTFLAHHWTYFARQFYFDRHGIFMSSLWSGPLLLIACLILVNNMFTLSSLVVKWKRAELRHRSRMAGHKEE